MNCNLQQSGYVQSSPPRFMDQSDGAYYWPPGTNLPLTPTTPSDALIPFSSSTTPTFRPMCYPPIRRLPIEEIEEEEPITFQNTLRELLQVQKQMQKQMNVILNRVDKIENIVKDGSISSSSSSTSSDHERQKRLPPELSVCLIFI